VGGGGAGGLLGWGGLEISTRQTLAPHQFVLFVIALLTTSSPIRSLSEVNANIQQGLAAARRLFALLDTVPDVQDRPGALTATTFRDRIRYEHVTFGYEDGRATLVEVSFEIRRGEIVALVGSSGAARSTTMDLLPRFYDPTGGRITMDGGDLREMSVASPRAPPRVVTPAATLLPPP